MQASDVQRGAPLLRTDSKVKHMAKSEKFAVALSSALEVLANQFADALAEGMALQEQLGDVARRAAALLKDDADKLAPFVDACRQLCVAHGLNPDSTDKTLSHLRGVIRAILGGWEAPTDKSLRQMYNEIPKDPNKGGRKPRQSAKGAQDNPAPAADAKPGDTIASAAANDPNKIDAETAIRRLFGHFDSALADAIEYAVKNERMFTAWAEASAKAAQSTKVQLKKAA
jgi:hypothetical protein